MSGGYLRFGKRRLLIIAVCLVMLTSSIAVMPASSASTTGSATLRVGVLMDMIDMNLFNLGTNVETKGMMLDRVFEGIAGVDYDSSVYPLLAESWTFDPGTLTVDIELRQGVVFHDGVELTADDVVFTYAALRSGTTYSSQIIAPFDQDWNNDLTLEEVEASVWATGDHSVRMQMSNPYGQFFPRTLKVPIIPEHIWADHVDSEFRVDVTWGSDPAALIGTGPFAYADGISNVYRAYDKFDGYWGKHQLTPAGYNLYPPNVDRLYYAVMSSIESAVNGLRSGQLDHVASSVPSYLLPLIDTLPSIAVDYLDDSGYFYLAFNEKKEPFGSLAFRKAVSHLIDKQTIVDVFMGGLGAVGETVVSPYFGEWHNEDVVDYIYDDPDDSTTSIPEGLLDDAGFRDYNGDGWRDLPDGTPMEKLVILAPPAEYDPVRIRSATMVANNLVKVGVDAEAKAVDFNTLVAKLTSFDYQMLTLGFRFSGYSECVSVLFDIYGHTSPSNTWAFWSEANPNPFYSDMGDVDTLADGPTQAIVDELADIEDAARSTFIVSDQVEFVREAQALLLDAVPTNALYYRVLPTATRVAWTGWMPYMGTLMNMFSLSELEGAGVDRLYIDASPGVNVGLSGPKTLVIGDVASGHLQVIDDLGDPIPDIDVSVSFDPISAGATEVAVTPSSGKTDSGGLFWFTLSGSAEGAGVLRASASDGISSDEDSMTLVLIPQLPTVLSLSATVGSAVLAPGGYTMVSVQVKDEYGLPVEGAEVTVDESLLGAGEVSPATAMTDSSGSAAMTYTASTVVPDAGHAMERLLLTVHKDGYQLSGTAYIEMMVYNDALPDWVVVRIDDVTTTALSSSEPSSTVTVSLLDDEGVPLAYLPLAVSYSDEAYVSNPVYEVTTDGDGLAVLEIDAALDAPTGAFKVVVRDESSPGSVPASITFTHVGDAPPSEEMYGGYVTYDGVQFMPALGSLDATAHVRDSNGAPVDGKAALILPASPVGVMVSCDDTTWNSLYDYAGIEIETYADGGIYLASGPFEVPGLATEWFTMEGVDIVGGEISINLYGVDVSSADVLGGIVVVPEASGYLDWMTFNFAIEGQTSIVGDYAYGRSYDVVAASHEVDDRLLLALREDYDATTVSATVTDEHGDPVEGAGLVVCQSPMSFNLDYGVLEYQYNCWIPDPVYTAADGSTAVTIVAVGRDYTVADYMVAASVYTVPSSPGALPLLSQSELVITPQKSATEGTPITSQVLMGDTFVVEAMISDMYENPIDDMTVGMYAGTDHTVSGESVTDSDGEALFIIDTSGILGSEGGFIPVTFGTSGPGYSYSAARLMVPAKNPRPVVTITEPAEGAFVTDSTVTVRGTVSDSNGISSVWFYLDGDGPYFVWVEPGSTYADFEFTLEGLSDGPHTIAIEATDMLLVKAVELRSFEVQGRILVVRNLGPSPESTVSTTFQPDSDGLWRATIQNNGLRALLLTVYEVHDDGSETRVAQQKVSFKGTADASVVSAPVQMAGGHQYLILFTPMGPTGGSALVSMSFEA
jgi:peptide/nickel transport system substrate-binding protein